MYAGVLSILNAWKKNDYTSCIHLQLLYFSSPAGNEVTEVLEFYREFFPTATITPKLHLLEDLLCHPQSC